MSRILFPRVYRTPALAWSEPASWRSVFPLAPRVVATRQVCSKSASATVPATRQAQGVFGTSAAGLSLLCATGGFHSFRRNEVLAKEEESKWSVKKLLDPSKSTVGGVVQQVADAFSHTSSIMGPIKARELAFGLYYLACLKKEAAPSDDSARRMRTNVPRTVVHRLFDHSKLALSIYDCPTDDDLRERVRELGFEVVFSILKSAKDQPAHFLAFDDRTKQCVLVVRGTESIDDLLTDLGGAPTVVCDGMQAHRGIAAAADWLKTRLVPTLNGPFKDYEVWVVGHSLGGAVGSMLTVLMHEDGNNGVKCDSFASPPFCDKRLSERAEMCGVTNVLLNHDIVARASPCSLEALRQELVDLPWEKIAKQEFDAVTNNLLDELETKVGKGATQWVQKVIDWGKAHPKLNKKIESTPSPPKSDQIPDEESLYTLTFNDTMGKLSAWVDTVRCQLERNKEDESTVSELVANKTVHFVPGRLVYVREVGADTLNYEAQFTDTASTDVKTIIISERMLSDHGCANYMDSLQRVLPKAPKRSFLPTL